MHWIWLAAYVGFFLLLTEGKEDPVLSHQCISTRYRYLTCELQMDADSNELLVWDVTFTTRDERNCGATDCKNVQCKDNFLSTDKKLVCVTSWLFRLMTYQVSVVDETANGTEILSSFSTTLDYTILRLGSPTVLGNKTNSSTISVHVQLYEGDMVSKRAGGTRGFIERDVQEHGIVYHVTTYIKKHANKVLKQQTLADNNSDSWLEITDLQPNTEYSIDIKTQVIGTDNTDIWSDITSLMLTTQMSIPAAAPEHSPFGFTITNSSTCKQGRTVILFWKVLSAKSDQGNGEITSYNIYKYTPQLTSEKDENATIEERHKGSLEKTIRTDNMASAEICVGDVSYELNVVPSNAVGPSQRASVYYIPEEDDVVQVRPCDVSVTYCTSNDVLTITWPNLPQEYNITVFWCQPGSNDSCLYKKVFWNETIEGNSFNLEGWQRTSSEHVWPSSYKFGLSAHASNYVSSGIVWTECISYIEEDMRAALVDIQLYELKAQVTIMDRCDIGRHLADRYTLMLCKYDVEKNACIEDITAVAIDLCSKSTTISLDEYSTDYAFWVVSHADDLSVKSEVLVKRTDGKEWMWEIVVLVVIVFLSAAASTLGLIYCNKQRRMVQKLRKPKLVKPTADQLFNRFPEENSAMDDRCSSYFRYAVRDQQPQCTPTLSANGRQKSNESTTSTANYQSAAVSCEDFSDSYVQCHRIEELPWNARWPVNDDFSSAATDSSQLVNALSSAGETGMPTLSSDMSEQVVAWKLSHSADYQLPGESLSPC